MAQSYFELLGLSWDASYTDVHAAYKRLREKWAKDPGRLQALEEAHKTLMDPGRRRAYMQGYDSARLASTLGETTGPGKVQTDTSASHTVQHGSPAESHTPSEVDGGPTSRTGQPAGQVRTSQPSPGGARQKTQYYEPLAGASAPTPAPDASQPPSSTRSGQAPASRAESSQRPAGRQKTEYYESVADAPGGAGRAGSGPAASPASQQPARDSRPDTPASGGRQKTVVFETGSVDQTPSPRVQTPSGGDLDQSGSDANSQAAGSAQAPAGQASSGRPGSKRALTETYSSGQADRQVVRGQNDETRMALDEVAERPASSASRKARLQVEISYQGAVESVPLEEGDNLVGRPPRNGPSPAVPLPDPKQFISRRHALLRVEGNACYVIDQGSDNGTYVNGRRLRAGEPYRLDIKNDVIRIEGRLLQVRPV